MGLRQPISRGRALPLPFWGDGWGLYDLEADNEDGTVALAFIAGPDRTFVIDGTSPPIHQLNHDLGMAQLVDETMALAYLKFFCGAVWGEAGPFAIVDTEEEAARWLKEPIEDSDIELPGFLKVPLVQPTAYEGREGQSWRFSGTVVYEGCLFASVFTVSPSGMVDMVDDEPVLQGKSRLMFRPPIRQNFGVEA